MGYEGRRGRSEPGAATVTIIEVYADIWCPFAHVGLRAVVARRHTLGRDDVGVRVRAWPLELINHAPLDPLATADHVEELRSQVLEDLEAGRSRGVQGSPHFFCGQLQSFCPALRMDRDEAGHLHIHRDTDGAGVRGDHRQLDAGRPQSHPHRGGALDDFLAACLSR